MASCFVEADNDLIEEFKTSSENVNTRNYDLKLMIDSI